jgi:hypothetical protein
MTIDTGTVSDVRYSVLADDGSVLVSPTIPLLSAPGENPDGWSRGARPGLRYYSTTEIYYLGQDSPLICISIIWR